MLDNYKIGNNIMSLRKEKGLTGEKLAELLGVSGQAVSKWENGKNLPETALLPSLAKILGVSIDNLLITEPEKVVETYKIENAVFELVERPETIYTGKMTEETTNFSGKPENYNICVSINFWNKGKKKKIFFVKETAAENQTDKTEVYKIPAGLFLRVYTSKNNADILGKDMCEPWEFFSFMYNCIMPKYKLKPSRNANGEDNGIEIYDSVNGNQRSGWAYAAVEREAT